MLENPHKDWETEHQPALAHAGREGGWGTFISLPSLPTGCSGLGTSPAPRHTQSRGAGEPNASVPGVLHIFLPLWKLLGKWQRASALGGEASPAASSHPPAQDLGMHFLQLSRFHRALSEFCPPWLDNQRSSDSTLQREDAVSFLPEGQLEGGWDFQHAST